MNRTLKKMLPFLALALLIPTAIATITVWNEKVFEVEVKEPIQVKLIQGPKTNVVWPGQCLRCVYEISNIGPMPYRIEISGALNGWENGQRKSWLGKSAPKVLVYYYLYTASGEMSPLSPSEGSLTFDLPANSTYRVCVDIWFHEDIEAGKDWSFYLSISRLGSWEGKG